MKTKRNVDTKLTPVILIVLLGFAGAGKAIAGPGGTIAEPVGDSLQESARELRALRAEVLELHLTVQQLTIAALERDLASAGQALERDESAAAEFANEIAEIDAQLGSADLEPDGQGELESTRDQLLAGQATLAPELRLLRERQQALTTRIRDETVRWRTLLDARSAVDPRSDSTH